MGRALARLGHHAQHGAAQADVYDPTHVATPVCEQLLGEAPVRRKKERVSPAYFHLGPHYKKTRIASWTKVELSCELCFSGNRSKTTNYCACRAFYHHIIRTSWSPLGHGWTWTRVLQVKSHGF